MTNEEKYIRQHAGSRSPFKVPEGYFEHFVPELMERLPEREARPLHFGNSAPLSRGRALVVSMRPLLYAAAVLFIAVMSVTVYLKDTPDEAGMQMAVQTTSDDAYYNEVADYAMVDNYDIYACLTND